MQSLKIFGLLALAAALGIIAMILIEVAPRVTSTPFVAPVVTNFEECAAAGNPVMESYPRQCRTADGRLFVEEISDFPSSESPISSNGCAVAGCSGQLCVSAEEAATVVTTCEFRAEYACYRDAACERQASGQCGWTQTETLQRCLANPPEMQLEVM
ncbi:MAG TPA: hypothetical protein VNM40_04455 [Candidatus Paceibacterota bacterium]|nr:hypothetical protein [Candidatus Paceibacterota bacterium]